MIQLPKTVITTTSKKKKKTNKQTNTVFRILKNITLSLQNIKCYNIEKAFLFVSPELSSGRDSVIQMSVRRALCTSVIFFSGAFLGNRMPYLDDIWYVGGRGGSSRWKGGAQIVDQWWGFQGAGPLAGVQGAEPPGGGCKGAEPPCVGKFWISELNSRDLVHTFCQHHIENLLIYFQ